MGRDGEFRLATVGIDLAGIAICAFGFGSARSAANTVRVAGEAEQGSRVALTAATAQQDLAASRQALAATEGYTKSTATALGEVDKNSNLLTGSALRSRLGREVADAEREAATASAAHDADLTTLRQAEHSRNVPKPADIAGTYGGIATYGTPTHTDASTRHVSFWDATARPWTRFHRGEEVPTTLTPEPIGR